MNFQITLHIYDSPNYSIKKLKLRSLFALVLKQLLSQNLFLELLACLGILTPLSLWHIAPPLIPECCAGRWVPATLV